MISPLLEPFKVIYSESVSRNVHQKIRSILNRQISPITMYKRTLTNLASLSKKEVKTFIDSFDVLLTDCDGVLWLDNQVYEGSPQVLNCLRELGKKIFFVTNNSTKFRDELLGKAQSMGYICKKVN